MADMNKDTIYRIALRCFNIDYDKIYPIESRNTGEKPVEVKYLDDFQRSAILFCARVHRWSFLMKNYTFGKEDRIDDIGSSHGIDGMPYCYKKPSDIIEIYYINGSYNNSFTIIGDRIYFSIENPTITYTTSDIVLDDFDMYPDDFGYLVAYRLGIEICQYISPNDTAVANMLSGNFQIVFQSLSNTESRSFRKKNPNKDWFVI